MKHGAFEVVWKTRFPISSNWNLFNSDHEICLQKLPHGEPRLVPYALIPGGWLDTATSLTSIDTKLGMLPFKNME